MSLNDNMPTKFSTGHMSTILKTQLMKTRFLDHDVYIDYVGYMHYYLHATKIMIVTLTLYRFDFAGGWAQYITKMHWSMFIVSYSLQTLVFGHH